MKTKFQIMIPAIFSWHLFWYVTIGVIGVILLLVGLKLYACCTLGVCKSKARMDGKVVIVTGCTSGLGKETAKDLAKRGAKVIMACRNIDSANNVKDELVKLTGSNNIVVRKLDLASLTSVREFARQINGEETKLDVLVHNAGVFETFEKKVTEDGLEMVMATNQYGPFLLTLLLIDLLKKSAPSRIVIVSSVVHRLSCSIFERMNPTTTLPIWWYFVSKYSNTVFTMELARRLQGSGVTANCLHPGLIDTDIWRHFPVPLSWIVHLINKAYAKTPEQGAQTTIHLAVTDEVIRVTGKYFVDCREHRPSRSAIDEAKGKKLWELWEGLVKLEPTDPRI